MRIEVDREARIGAGECVLAEPGVFDQHDDDGTVRVLAETPEEEHRDGVLTAVDRCPANVIRVVGD